MWRWMAFSPSRLFGGAVFTRSLTIISGQPYRIYQPQLGSGRLSPRTRDRNRRASVSVVLDRGMHRDSASSGGCGNRRDEPSFLHTGRFDPAIRTKQMHRNAIADAMPPLGDSFQKSWCRVSDDDDRWREEGRDVARGCVVFAKSCAA
jgi:hypothetical protein